MAEQLLTVGKLVNTHGIKGEIKVLPITDFPEERFAKGKRLLLIPEGGKPSFWITIDSARYHKNMYILKLEGYSNINEVEKYKGSMLKVSKDDLIELPENEYYYHDIIGCSVITDENEDKPLGVITEIISPGANDVWVVKPTSGADILIPVIDDVVLDVDVNNKKVKIHLMEGLL
ncbi:ribosome maturation factor RimM [Paenibacillus crassostreae]|uniref:Ribosome maturation factor RimM n=1 Tax=Paenibacillus crassostreae TaxID=1763538 RepID=A0A167FPF2_9BACL|nr:ribosome maturation factor RimM [Paenibacillus crassostreae]AOZ94197.1 ribosome maturation factor RimM [Paenibacillus crassostreae]OAB76767.1 ribosome maturation factor RimM [Paenibacillus crassostreae]